MGWSGVGADNKYCILETCKQCKNPTRRAAPYNDQLYCDMTPHSDMSESGNGACGKHQFTGACECKCASSPAKWAYTNGFSVRPKCTGAEKLTGTFQYFTSGKASGCEHRNHYLYDYRGSDCIWESNKI